LDAAAVRRFVADLTGDELHVKQVDSLAHAVVGALHADRAGVASIGRAAAHERDVVDKHSIKQVDRLLSNGKIEPTRVMRRIVRRLVGDRKDIVVAIDWTEYAPDEQSTVMVSLVNEHGRATPLTWKTVDTSKLKHRRAGYEDDVLWMLHGALPDGVRVTVLADRGFGDRGLYALLAEKLRFDFVVRFKGGVVVESESGEVRPAAEWVPPNGQARFISNARITRGRQLVDGVVVVKRAGMREAWCLATSRRDAADVIVDLYARRFDIEHTFRDQKDRRFGFGLYYSSVGTPGRRDRLLLVIVIASLIATLLGAAGEAAGLDKKLRANTENRRTHSLWRQGREYIAGVARSIVAEVRHRFIALSEALGSSDRNYAAI
jgi:hypothetical protein